MVTLITRIVDELPPGRKPINSVLLNNIKRAEVIERIHLACNSGQQVYWICPLIEASEVLQCEAAQDTAALLTQQLNNIKVGLVHGRLSGTEKAEVMAQFKAGDIQLLVATTVVEVGVDVPNANLMVIDNAERLGLSSITPITRPRGPWASPEPLLIHVPSSFICHGPRALRHPAPI